MTTVNELLTLQTHFWIGNYQMAVHESTLLNPTAPAAQQGRKVYMLRAYIAMKNYDLVLEETTEKGPLPLRAMRVLAQYMRSSGSARADVVLRVLALLAEPGNPADVTVQLVAGTVLSNEGRHRDALRALKSDKDLDVLALSVHVLLRMHRIDLAEKQLAKMQRLDEEVAITQLASAWVHAAQGGKKCQEANYIIRELIERHGPTVLLLNCLAVTDMQLGNYADAERSLLDALSKNASEPETLVNLIACSQHAGRGAEVGARYMRELKRNAPEHPFVRNAARLEEEFTASAQAF